MMIFTGDKLQFDDGSYFMMIFTAGVAVGLFLYGASEPMWHYTGSNRYAKSGHTNDMTTGRVSSLSSARLFVGHDGSDFLEHAVRNTITKGSSSSSSIA